MRAQDHEFVRLLAAFDFGDDVRGLDRSAELIRNGEVGPHQVSGGQQARHALTVFTRHQHHRQFVDFPGAGICVAVEDVVLTRGHESERQSLPFHREIDHRRSLGVLGEKIVPRFENDGVHQNDLAGNVASFFEIGFCSLIFVDNRDALHRSQRRSPRHGHRAHAERREQSTASYFRRAHLLGGCGGHLGGAFRPRVWNGEAFGVHAVGAGGGEGLHSPCNGVLHGRRAGDAAADFVGQAVKIIFQR